MLLHSYFAICYVHCVGILASYYLLLLLLLLILLLLLDILLYTQCNRKTGLLVYKMIGPASQAGLDVE